MALKPRDRVFWRPSSERGVVLKRDGRELWVRWESGRTDKLHVEEDAAFLFLDADALGMALSVREVERRAAIERMRPCAREDGSPAELERVYREAASIRQERTSNIDPRPTSVSMKEPKPRSGKGRCSRCHNRPPAPDRKECEPCRASRRSYRRRIRAKPDGLKEAV